MTWLPGLLSFLSSLPLERLHAFIALGALGVAALAIYAVLTATKGPNRR